MLINLRNALMAGKRLPYDAEVEFLESTGTQWIDTGEKIYDDTAATVTMYNDHSTESATYFFGSDSSTERFYFREYQGNASFSTGGWWQNTSISIVGTHTVAMTNNSITVDGVSSSRTGTSKTGAGKLQLFKSGTYTMTADGVRIYSCQIWQNGVLVRDYIPVRKGTVGYLYDRVSKKLFGNEGTGDFVLGPDVVPVEYIESHGTEYIDTGFVPKSTSGIYIDFIPTVKGATNVVCGSRTNGTNTRFWVNPSSEVVAYGFGNFYDNSGVASVSGERYKVKVNHLNDGLGSCNGRSISLGAFAGNLYSVYIFGANVSNTPTFVNTTFDKVFEMELTDSQDVARHFRSIRVGTDATSWEGAMMDVLTRRIYRNQGTGAFTFGNDLRYSIPAS